MGRQWVALTTDSTAPYVLDLETTTIPTSWNEIGVIAYDKAGRATGDFADNWIFILVKRFISLPLIRN
jgi:hypothetical protein